LQNILTLQQITTDNTDAAAGSLSRACSVLQEKEVGLILSVERNGPVLKIFVI
jgi:hypothetical protein